MTKDGDPSIPIFGEPIKGRKYKYGFNWRQGTHDLAIELAMFREKITRRIPDDTGGHKTADHFLAISKALWPEKDYKSGANFIWHPWAHRMLDASCRHDYLAIAGSGGFGKCLAPNTPVLMYDGSTKLAKDVVVGDQLMGDDSTPRNVLVTNPGRSNMVRIIPKKGDPWECNDDHILTLKRAWATKKGWRRVGEVIDISVKDYLKKSETFKEQFKLFCTGVDWEEKPLPIEPRAYGIWLGDGSTGKTHITSSDNEVLVNNYIYDYFTKNGYDVKKEYYGKSAATWMISRKFARGKNNPFLRLVHESSGYVDRHNKGTKRILKEYLINSRKNRLELLAGLIDSDGYTNGTAYEIACSYPSLAKDIVFLARSLGFRVVTEDRKVKCNNGWHDTCRISIMGDVWQIPAFRKVARPKQRTRSETVSFEIEQLGEGDWSGFQVDGNGRFLLGDFTVTHNSEFFAIWAIINYLCDPENTIVLATSTTIKASKQRIWGKIVKYWQICEQLGLPGKLVDSLNTIRYVDNKGKATKGDLAGITLIPGEKKKEKDATGKMQGIHQKNVIFVADELSELSEAITEVAFYNLSKGCERFQFIGISNPASYVDAFGKFAKPKAGWESITVEDDDWETERGVCVHFDTLKNPNMERGKKVYPWMDGPEDLEKVPVSERNTASYWRMYRGFWCPAGVTDQIYSEVEIINSRSIEKAIWLDNELVKVAFLDPSFTNGGDRAILYFGTVGKLIEPYGYRGLQYDEFLKFAEDVTDQSSTRTEQIVRWFREECVKRGVQPRNAGYDKSGAGGPLGDVISIAWSKDVFGLQFGGKASDKPVSAYDQTPAHERYVNSVSEIWYSLKEYMRAGQIKGISNDMMQEMCQRKLDRHGVKDLNLRIKVMPKSEMKLTYGMSPDIADAGMGLLALCRERLGLDSTTATKAINQNNKAESKGWKEAFSKFRTVYR